MSTQHNPRCRAQHCVEYAIRPSWMAEAIQHIRSGLFVEHVYEAGVLDQAGAEPNPNDGLPMVVRDGIATIFILGPMMKGWSKYADTDTRMVRRAVVSAASRKDVEGIMLMVDSPGGGVPGVEDLASAVSVAARDHVVHAYIDDLGCSAAFWAIAGANRISANQTAIVGSIGAFTKIEDTSEMAKDLGVKVHVIQSGPMKAGAVDGVPVSEAVLAETQRVVDGIAGVFFAAVGEGRGLEGEQLDAVTTGQVWMAGDAVGMGLLDAVESSDVAYDRLRQAIEAKGTKARDRADAALRFRRAR